MQAYHRSPRPSGGTAVPPVRDGPGNPALSESRAQERNSDAAEDKALRMESGIVPNLIAIVSPPLS